MNKANGPLDRITMALGVALLTATALTGCLGFVGGGGDYGGEVVVPGPDVYVGVPGPDVYLFGGGYDRGRDVHDYSHRGHESRAAARPERRAAARPESHAPAHSGGGGHEEKR